MSEITQEPPNDEFNAPNFSPRLYGIAVLVAAIIITGTWLIARFTAVDLARDIQTWQEKLNLIAESRANEIDGWVAGHFKELHTLADNPSLQLYLTELQAIPPEKTNGDEPAQKTYLRNLLLFTADRAGFNGGGGIAAIRANVQQEEKGGLAVLNNQNDIVVSTAMPESTRDLVLQHVKNLSPGQDGLIDLQKDAQGNSYIGFMVPIFSIQGERNANSQIGRVAGIKAIGGNLFDMLKHPGVTEKTLEAILLRAGDNKLEFISPLQDGTAALSKTTERDKNRYVEARLLETPGNFLSEGKDYRDKPVLATSRMISGTPWVMIAKIDRPEALSESSQRRASMVVFFFLIIAIIVLLVIAVWWHASSKRSMMMSYHFKKIAAQARAQEWLLRLVADNQPEPIYILDTHHVYHFANRKTAEESAMAAGHIVGKTLMDVRGSARAEPIIEQCDKALRQKQTGFSVLHIPQDGAERVIRSAYVPLAHIPVAGLPEPTPGVLVVEQDISEVVHERERRIGTHHQLVQALVSLVDKRDPFSANHSLLVSQLAYEIANDMALGSVTSETTRFAGCLMNIGKIVVPTELLTKTDSLTPDEKHIIRDSMNAAADAIRGIHFDGPVAETLRQWPEKWDGSGPMGLRGDEILISARIIAAANAFIGMISPRSWRTAIPIEAATKLLLEQTDRDFDRRVVIALINYVENHSGRMWLNEILDSKKSVA